MNEPWGAEEVPEALAGERIDRFVALMTGCSRAEATRAIASGSVLVSGRAAAKGSVRLERGDRVEVLEDPRQEPEAPEADPGVEIDVVHEDADVVVIDKPEGLVVHPAPGHAGGTLVHGLLARYPELAEVGEPERPGIVHRLDRGTSGLLVVARTTAAYESLVGQLASHSVHREYAALVWGRPKHPRGVIDAPVGRSRRDPLRMTVAVDGRPARTHYELEEGWDDPEVALLACTLETGRTHQIRVHLASVGHPVVGDPLYGAGRGGLADAASGRRGVRRPFLHARRLSFVHPGHGREVSFSSPLPGDLAGLLEDLGEPDVVVPGSAPTGLVGPGDGAPGHGAEVGE